MSALDLGTLTGYLALDDAPMQGTLDRLPASLSGAGAAMGAGALALGAYIGAELVGGLQDAVEAERLNDRLAAALNLDPAAAERAGRVAGQLYVNAYGESLEEVNGAVEAVISSIGGMADASDEELQRITGSVMDMASAFELDTTRAAQVAGQLLTTGLARDGQHAVDLLTASLQRVPAAVREDVLDAASEYGPMFAQLGLSGEEAMGLLASAGEDGAIGIDKMGDAIKEFTIRATDMSTASVAAYEAAGLNAEDMAARILAGGETANQAFDEIVAGLQGIEDPTERANASIALFGTPIEDLGTGAIPQFLDGLSSMSSGLGDVTGAAADMGSELNGNTATSWTTIQRTFDSVWQGLSANLLPILGDLTSWLASNPELVNAIVVAVIAFAVALGVLAAAQWAANSAMLASPITWIILAIAAVVAALVFLAMNWDAVAAWISTTWSGFLGWLQGVMDGFVGWWNGLWAAVGAWVQGVWNGFVGWIQGVWNGFVGWLMAAGAAISAWWNGLWSSVGSFVQAAWNAIVAWVVGIIVGWIAGMIAQGQRIVSWWTGLWATVRSNVMSAWNGIVSWIGGIPDRILGALSGAATWLVNIGRDVLNGLMSGLQAGWNAVVGWIEGLGGGIIDTFASILGIHSPSRVFRAFGVNIVEGLGLGLDDEQAALDARVASLVTVPDVPSTGSQLASALADDRAAAAAAAAATAGQPAVARFDVYDRDGVLLGTMDGAAARRSEQDATTAGLGRKPLTPVL